MDLKRLVSLEKKLETEEAKKPDNVVSSLVKTGSKADNMQRKI